MRHAVRKCAQERYLGWWERTRSAERGARTVSVIAGLHGPGTHEAGRQSPRINVRMSTSTVVVHSVSTLAENGRGTAVHALVLQKSS